MNKIFTDLSSPPAGPASHRQSTRVDTDELGFADDMFSRFAPDVGDFGPRRWIDRRIERRDFEMVVMSAMS